VIVNRLVFSQAAERHVDSTKHKAKFTPLTRTGLQDFTTAADPVSEGDLVSVSGFLHHADNGEDETVNCGGADGVDIHLNGHRQGNQPQK
jgi:hypothetical protein